MKDFMEKHPEFILKILEVQGFSPEKLEQILTVYNDKSFDFKLGASCPDGIFLETELEKSFYHLDYFQKYLEEKNFNYENMRVIGQHYPEGSYRAIINLGTPDEFRIFFYPPSKKLII